MAPLDDDTRDQLKSQAGALTDQASDQVERAILEFCRIPRRAAEIQKHLGLRHRTYFRDNYLRPMTVTGWIGRTVPDKPQRPLQKYVTTEARERELANRD